SSLRAEVELLLVEMSEAWQCDWSAWTDVLVEATFLFVLGRGLGLGAALEAALLFKDSCCLLAEAYRSGVVMLG
ncbi:iron dicitrate transport regulator FecR, partial [Stenotrophomonas maltophilia]